MSESAQNLARFYHDLANKQDALQITDYGVFGEFASIAQALYNARMEKGEDGFKDAINALRIQNSQLSRKALIAIASAPIQPPAKTAPTITESARKDDNDSIPQLPEEMRIAPGTTKGLCPLKDEYVAYSKEASPEGYEGFHSSCFWGMLSIIAGRRVVTALGKRKYTPLTVVLAARSGFWAKTDTSEVQRDVIKTAGLDYLLGLTRTTPQKLLMDMSGPIPENYAELSPLEQQDVKRCLAMSGQRGWIYQEFGKLISAMTRTSGAMADFVETLLQISDTPDELNTGTIARGNETIIKPYLAITGTLTPASIKAVSDKNSELWNDGFYARIAFSCAPHKGFENKPFKNDLIPVPNALAMGVRAWHNRLGEPELDILPICNDEGEPTGRYKKVWVKELPEHIYRMSNDAYKAWASYRGTLREIVNDMPTTDLDSSYARLPDLALRVSALAASLEGAGQIEYKHWLLGQEQAEEWRASLHRLYAQVNGALEAEAEQTAESELLAWMRGQARPVTARDIVQRGPYACRRMKSKGVRELLAELSKDGVIERDYTEGSNKECYKPVSH